MIPVVEHADSGWNGEVGYITYSLIKTHIPDTENVIYYICGSPAMVTTVQETILEMGINANLIKVEDFPGY